MRMVLATSFSKRLKGLLWSKPTNEILLLMPCKSIHTFGMKYAIDIAFVDVHGNIEQSFRDVLPRQKMKCKEACAVLERYATPHAAWFQKGDFVSISCGVVLHRGRGLLEEDLDTENDGERRML